MSDENRPEAGTIAWTDLTVPDAAEVEFMGQDGRTRCVQTFLFNDILVLNREHTPTG